MILEDILKKNMNLRLAQTPNHNLLYGIFVTYGQNPNISPTQPWVNPADGFEMKIPYLMLEGWT